ncbi:uncharacterized protein M421DRAFT_336733 [Didymella exigua CBS 183.55]|uniref:Uncharacterized protein n=1 Tax=Didymella exigua CBS 183.55 TaxID=1150837 RepID=A0A6A5R497_9PLEO|nr:uncharacterized protein M421DRAFT_336733 [Didymella exigua CBS 183.55]KAF1922911.1 hypothetical protein M421DRAFT_336733 [Didymella exigua CBS 183.55]
MSRAQWSDKPNTRAREILEENHDSSAALLKDLQEPEYACRDVEVRDGVWQMMAQIEAFAKAHFSFELKDKTRLQAAFQSMPKETIKIIGCVVSSGPGGASGWEDLFIDSSKRQALVCAITGNTMVEQVFQHIFFGGTSEQIKEVAAIQYEHRNNDGFTRNTLHATKIRSLLAPTKHNSPPLHLPPNFNAHVTHTVAALLTHLMPLLTLHAPNNPTPLIPALYALTTHTALLSLAMRLTPHTVYHFPPSSRTSPTPRPQWSAPTTQP